MAEEEAHESHHEERPFTKKARSNPWMISTIVLAIFALILIIGSFSGLGLTGNVISEKEAGQIIVDFAEQQTGEPIELVGINEEAGLYEVVVLYQEQEVPLYITKDGKNLVQGLTPLAALQEQATAAQSEPAEVPKSDKPVVELFIMTHCPYGTQAEKGFIPVIKSLGNEIDATIRFVHYFMHDPEEEETPRQVCIREEQSTKYLSYLECFLEDGDAERCLTEAGIDKTKLQECIAGNADSYYEGDSSLSQDYGVQGSPTLIVNGQIVSSGRSPDAFLQTICRAFNTAPSECALELSSESPSPGFGYEGTGSNTQAQC